MVCHSAGSVLPSAPTHPVRASAMFRHSRLFGTGASELRLIAADLAEAGAGG